MPELPDLHIFSENLNKRLPDRIISSVTVYNTRKIATPDYYRKNMEGSSISGIVRDGKELFFNLANGNCFAVHLMLHGGFFIGGWEEAEKVKGKILGLGFETETPDNTEFFLIADVQNLCRVSWNPKPGRVPDAMSEKFTLKYFLSGIKRNELRNIKTLLVDQSLVRGIGNAYADEILWKAGISPESFSGKIPEVKLKELYEAIPAVFNDAIQNIRKISPDIISGEERSFMRVHIKDREYNDEGEKIIIKTIGEKSTYFTAKQIKYM